MPLAPLETCLFPETLLAVPPEASAARWWVLHTRPRAEKMLARKLLSRQVGFFLPLYEHRLGSGGRVRSSFLPLFPSYLFLFGTEEARGLAMATDLVAAALDVADQPRLFDDLAGVHRMLETRRQVTPESRLRPGAPVRIIAGPLAGLTGIVERRGRQLHFIVAIRFFSQGVSTEIESWMLEPTNDAIAAHARV